VVRKGRIRIQGTHRYVEDPEVEQILDAWVRLLAETLGRTRPVPGDFDKKEQNGPAPFD
jgi:hypothetical protein